MWSEPLAIKFIEFIQWWYGIHCVTQLCVTNIKKLKDGKKKREKRKKR